MPSTDEPQEHAEGDARLIEGELKGDGLWLWVEMADGIRVELTAPYGHWAFDSVNRAAARAAETIIRRLPFDSTDSEQIHVLPLRREQN